MMTMVNGSEVTVNEALDRGLVDDWMATEIGPRRIGGRYFNGYWRQSYEVLDIRLDAQWSMTVKWADGSITTHATAWNPRRDKVIS